MHGRYHGDMTYDLALTIPKTRKELENLQEERLRETLIRAFLYVPFYRKLFNRLNINPNNIELPKDISLIPPTTPEILREYGSEFVAEDVRIYAVHGSGTTTGYPKLIYRTYNDFKESAKIAAWCFQKIGVREDDRVLIAQPFGFWAVGNITMEAFRLLGALSIPLGLPPNNEIVLYILKKTKPNVIWTSPTRMLLFTRYLLKHGINPKEHFNVRLIITAGDKISVREKEFLREEWGAEVYEIYGSEETDCLGFECSEHSGIHILENYFYVEIVNPETFEPVKVGEIGKILITTLTKEGMPLIRYDLGDFVRLLDYSCSCGVPFIKVEVLGRSNDVLVLSEGTKIYPYQVEDLLKSYREIIQYQLILDEKNGKDVLIFLLEVRDDVDVRDLESRLKNDIWKLSSDFADAINEGHVEVVFKFVKEGYIQPTERGKIKRFIDKRRETL